MLGNIICLTGMLGILTAVVTANPGPPPNKPAGIKWNAEKGTIELIYDGKSIFNAEVMVIGSENTADTAITPSAYAVKLNVTEKKQKTVKQQLTFSPAKPETGIVLAVCGTVAGSAEAFSAETVSPAQKRFPCVRNSVGLSLNLRNNAVYDRNRDWVLSGPGDGMTRVALSHKSTNGIVFGWKSTGTNVTLVFRPLYYQKHKNLKHYQPWTYTPWKESVTGWCSWWPYRAEFKQEKLDELVDVWIEKNLRDFGYWYIQIDDAFQTGKGMPEGWLTWNSKFPGGPEYAV